MIRVNDAGFIYDDSPNPYWLPPINLKQFEVFNDFHRYLLVHGPRKSSKTWGICHKVIRHAFDTNGAMAAIVCKTIKNAKSSGVWTLLTTKLMPLWEQNCHGFKIVEGPKTSGDTKLSFIRIRNRHGTISEIQCHSLEHSAEVEAKFKGPAYSFFWLSEFDQYCDEHAFDIFCDALRMTPFVPYEEHQIICDCNPPETGTENWIHDKWFKFKEAKPKDGDDEIFRDGLHQILVALDDNPQLDARERRELEARYKKRKALFNRFIKGLWEQDIVDGHFSHVWDESIHVLGSADGPKEEWDVIVPTDSCHELLTGWDIGDRNHSFHIIEKSVQSSSSNKTITSFSILDELVSIKSSVSTSAFCEEAFRKIEYWNKWMMDNHNRTISWRHWSDTSAWNFSATAATVDAAVVFEATGGQVRLMPAPKHRNSNHDKVNLLAELMHLKRLWVSAQLHRTRVMFANLKSGGDAEFIKENEHKHPFDSLSYPILAEAPMDFFKNNSVRTEKQREIDVVTAGV